MMNVPGAERDVEVPYTDPPEPTIEEMEILMSTTVDLEAVSVEELREMEQIQREGEVQHQRERDAEEKKIRVLAMLLIATVTDLVRELRRKKRRRKPVARAKRKTKKKARR